MMTSARAAIEFCGERLDDASIRTFSDLQPALKKFINENAKSEQYKIAPGDDENVRERYRRRGRADICEGEGLRVSKALLPLILADESVMKIRKRLESPSDPMLGDAPCL
jgi:hypothetical protein